MVLFSFFFFTRLCSLPGSSLPVVRFLSIKELFFFPLSPSRLFQTYFPGRPGTRDFLILRRRQQSAFFSNPATFYGHLPVILSELFCFFSWLRCPELEECSHSRFFFHLPLDYYFRVAWPLPLVFSGTSRAFYPGVSPFFFLAPHIPSQQTP